MSEQELKERTLESFERMFGQGDLDYVDEMIASGAVDHQEPLGTDFAPHLKNVITALRNGFPDLRFEVHEALAEGDVVATRSTMTGTHRGALEIGPLGGIPPEGAEVSVPHMHFFRYDDQGRLLDLWHVWDTPKLARDLGLPAPNFSAAATS